MKLVRMTALDDAPWNWGDNWNSDMPTFFAQVKGEWEFAIRWLVVVLVSRVPV